MSKAVAGAAMIGFDIALLATIVLVPGAGIIAATLFNAIGPALFFGGIAMEAAAIGQALTDNRGMNITTRMVAGLRQVIYGIQRVGGTVIYQSTTGAGGASGNYVYNYVIAVATHQLDAYINVFLDGRQVFWSQSGSTSNIGCGKLPTPPTTSVTVTGGSVSSISATGGAGLANVKPTRYRVRIYDPGGGKGAVAWATNSGSTSSPVWSITVASPGVGYTSATTAEVQGAYTFGGQGAADQQDPSQPGYGLGYGVGPNGQAYDFAGKVYCEARFGDQPPGDYMTSLTANDFNWPSTTNVSGIAYLYLNVGYDAAMFPSAPEIRITVSGKNDIYDPRTGLTGYSENWALQVADVIGNMGDGIAPPLGLGDGPITAWPADAIAQLVAAANVCDEAVETSQGNTSNYSQSIHYDLSTSPGDVLGLMMPSAAGRLSRIGGGWYIWPAYWQGPSFEFDESVLVDAIQWTPTRSFRDLVNCVNGTYVAPNYPYSTKVTGGIPGQLYDGNGWYYGTIDDLWPLAFQPTSFPQYAQDVRHGYSANEWLIEDGGTVLPKELTLRGVLDIVQAQRVAKITLLRNRSQGSGTLRMQLAGWQMQPTDVMAFTCAVLAWTSKILEVESARFMIDEQKGEGEDAATVLALSVEINVIETASTIYEWSLSEELTPYDVPAAPSQIPYTPAAPSSVTVACSAATALVAADGIVTPQALVSWTAPEDISVIEIQLQYQLVGASSWLNGGTVDVALFEAFVGPLVAGQEYNFRVRSVRASGTFSGWVTVSNVLASITLSIIVTSGVQIAPGALTAYAEPGGTADIVVTTFTATFGNVTVTCVPSGAFTLTGLNCSELYYIYYVDPNFLGGAITPIATQDPTDFLNKLGYFLIGSITTPAAAGVTYRPTGYIASGSSTPTNPAYAYDGNPTTCASIIGSATGTHGTPPLTAFGASVEYYMFPSSTLAASATLTVTAAASDGAGGTCSGDVSASLDGGSTFTSLFSSSITVSRAQYTLTVPSGQLLSNVQVVASTIGSTGATAGALALQVFDINIQ